MFTVKRYVKGTQSSYYGDYCNASVRYRAWHGIDGKTHYDHSHCREEAVLVIEQDPDRRFPYRRQLAYCTLHGRAEIAQLTNEVVEEEGQTENETVENNGAA